MRPAAILPFFFILSCGVLSPVKDASVNHVLDAVVPERVVTGTSPVVAIARPALPGYLDRQQLVSRGAGGRILMNSFQLWAEPLDLGISRVTALNLGRLANSHNIQPVESFVAMDYDHLLEIRVTRFEPDAGGNLVLECTWKLQPVSGRATAPRAFRTSIAVPVMRDPLAPQTDRIAAMDEALARLAREIARTL
jgi:uncharacterized lipoprotein YmbA